MMSRTSRAAAALGAITVLSLATACAGETQATATDATLAFVPTAETARRR